MNETLNRGQQRFKAREQGEGKDEKLVGGTWLGVKGEKKDELDQQEVQLDWISRVGAFVINRFSRILC